MPLRAIKLLISLSVAAADWVAAQMRELLGRRPAPRCVVLYYHGVRRHGRARFAAQMDDLTRLSVPVAIAATDSRPEGRRYSAVTFDDGLMSVVENALPELLARRIPCEIFVPTGSIGRHPSWIAPEHHDASEVVASAAVLRSLARVPLVRIGSHSVSHADFRSLDDAAATDELMRSKTMLEDVTGREVTTFSFPHGAYTPRSLDLARQCGYARVFTIEPVQLKNVHKAFAIGRVRVEPHDWPIEFRLKVLGAYRWMVRASRLKRDLLGIMRGRRVVAPQPPQSL